MVENSQGKRNDHKRNAEFQDRPRLKNKRRHIKVIIHGIHHSIGKNNEPQGKNHGEGNEHRKEKGFHLHPEIVLNISVSPEGFIRCTDHGIHTLGGSPQGSSKTDSHPYGASRPEDAENIILENLCHIRRKIGQQAQDVLNLRRSKKEDEVHQEDHGRHQSQDKVIGAFRRMGSYIIVQEAIDQRFEKKDSVGILF